MKKEKNIFRLNNSGFAITSIIYAMLLLFVILMTLTILTLGRRKNLLDKSRDEAKTLLNEFYEEYEFDYTGSAQNFVAKRDGYYKVELWGAQGGSNELSSGGKGAYTEGIIYLSKNQNIYIYVGSEGKTIRESDVTAGYNGGGSGTFLSNLSSSETLSLYGGGGGGATDIRLVDGDWNNASSLKSRIMVAAGGSGASNWSNPKDGSAGGAINGLDGKFYSSGTEEFTISKGATQNSGGIGANNSVNGGYGYGATPNSNFGSGAGGGYYGGGSGSGTDASVGTGSSGSSFISGYNGCDAIDENGNHTGQATHYSKMIFENSNMISGDLSMPTYDGENVMVGNSGDGHAKITYVGKQISTPNINLEFVSFVNPDLPIINENSFQIYTSSNKYKLDLPDAGYSFDWNIMTGYGSIRFCNYSDECTEFRNINSNVAANGNYVTSEPGYLLLSFGGVQINISNVAYRGEVVNINLIPPQIDAPSFTVQSDCTYSNGSYSCTNMHNTGDTASGDIYVFASNQNSRIQQFSIDGGEWVNGTNSAVGYYTKITEKGRHNIRVRSYYSSIDIYSKETEEFIINIE